jgi:hypothetical protein
MPFSADDFYMLIRDCSRTVIACNLITENAHPCERCIDDDNRLYYDDFGNGYDHDDRCCTCGADPINKYTLLILSVVGKPIVSKPCDADYLVTFVTGEAPKSECTPSAILENTNTEPETEVGVRDLAEFGVRDSMEIDSILKKQVEEYVLPYMSRNSYGDDGFNEVINWTKNFGPCPQSSYVMFFCNVLTPKIVASSEREIDNNPHVGRKQKKYQKVKKVKKQKN